MKLARKAFPAVDVEKMATVWFMTQYKVHTENDVASSNIVI